MARHIPVIAIVGRTNVGKSTLYNAIVGRRVAVVEDTPGVTRDRSYALVSRYGFPFKLVDTGGLVGDDKLELQQLVRAQSEIAIAEADLILAVFDGVHGLHPLDHEVVDILRTCQKPILWIVNKCEKPETAFAAPEFYQLGIENIHCLSAAHRVGIRELIQNIRETIGAPATLDLEESVTPKSADEIRVAIVGKPNVGKSTLINTILGEDRLVTSPVAGTTTDAVDISLTRDGQKFVIVDTAGLRKKARVDSLSVERFSNMRTLKAVAGCDVAVLLLDATEGLPVEQDAKIAGLIHERGRSLVIAVNKWDAIEKDHRSAKEYKDAVFSVFKFARYAPVLFVSALTGKRCPKILTAAKTIYEESRLKIKTSELNKLLRKAFESKPPPVYRGEPVKLLFAAQIEISPPTFVIFVNHPERIDYAYQRYIKNYIRQSYPFAGVDIKLEVRKRRERAKGGHSSAAA